MSWRAVFHHAFASRFSRIAPCRYRGSRIAFDIAGEPVWFSSDDVSLTATPEAMAVLSTAAASLTGKPLAVTYPACPRLIENLHQLERIWSDWWGTHPGHCALKPATPPRREPDNHRSLGAFFTLGVDSFHTLLKNPDLDTLIYVWGYDVSLSEPERFRKIEKGLRHVGAEQGKRVVIVHTNLRDHDLLGSVSWERLHGAALAVAGHILSEHLHTVLISASYSSDNFHPWGSSWKTDHLWSSDAFQVRHVGHTLTRSEKLAAISDSPLAQRYLRVCWQHRNQHLNCGLCEKCIRTMLGLLAIGKLESFSTFTAKAELAGALRNLPCISGHIHMYGLYQDILRDGLPAGMATEVETLLQRSRDNHDKANAEQGQDHSR